jgi:hypothetical protein
VPPPGFAPAKASRAAAGVFPTEATHSFEDGPSEVDRTAAQSDAAAACAQGAGSGTATAARTDAGVCAGLARTQGSRA